MSFPAIRLSSLPKPRPHGFDPTAGGLFPGKPLVFHPAAFSFMVNLSLASLVFPVFGEGERRKQRQKKREKTIKEKEKEFGTGRKKQPTSFPPTLIF